jgi:hypothetical protein
VHKGAQQATPTQVPAHIPQHGTARHKLDFSRAQGMPQYSRWLQDTIAVFCKCSCGCPSPAGALGCSGQLALDLQAAIRRAVLVPNEPCWISTKLTIPPRTMLQSNHHDCTVNHVNHVPVTHVTTTMS